MHRPILYSQETPRSFDFLWAYKDALYALAQLSQDLLGKTATVVGGLGASAQSPASLSISLGVGSIYQLAAVDSTAYGALATDENLIMQQGYAAAQSVLLSTAGLAAGQSQWALIEASFGQVDAIRSGDPNGGILQFWNSNDPTTPLEGQGNNNQPLNTVRQGLVSISVIYGTAATTGSEVPPNPSAGAVPLYLVDLAFGQTAINQNQILVAGPSVGANVPNNYPDAPFLAGLTNQHHRGSLGQAPQIDLTAEVQNKLPLANLPASSTSGGGLAVFKLNAGNPNGNVAGNANVNGASDLAYDTTNKILYVCITSGTASTAVWQAAGGSSSGQTSQFSGGTTGGAANAQTVAATTPGGFALTAGYVVTATIGAGLTNTGAATLNVDGTGAIAINKITGGGDVALTGGELIAGDFCSLIYTGSVWLLQSGGLGQLATMNIGTWLKNDGSGNLTVKNGLGLADDGAGNLTVATGEVTEAMLGAAAGAQQPYAAPISTQGAGNLTLSNDPTNPNFEVDIAIGRVRDDSDVTNMQLAAAMVKRLDQSWAAGTGNGACDASTKSPNQTWHAYLIGKTQMAISAVSRTSNVASLTINNHNLGVGSSIRVYGQGGGFDGLQVVTAVTTNTVNYNNAGSNVSGSAPATAFADGFDVLFSQSYPLPTLPTGYTTKQCLGSITTDASDNIRPFVQLGDEFLLVSPIATTISTSTSSARTLIPLAGLPLGVKVDAKVRFVSAMPTQNGYYVLSSPDQTDLAASITNADAIGLNGSLPGVCDIIVRTDTSANVGFRGSAAFGGYATVVGYRDPRRRLF